MVNYVTNNNNLISQKTLAQSISLSGNGLHSGREITLTISPSPADTGIVFSRSDLDDSVIKACALNVCETTLCTTISNSTASVATVEHLMSALYAMGIDNALVTLNGPEIPILDGSAQVFIDSLERAGMHDLEVPRRYLEIIKPIEVRDGEKNARFTPSDELVFDLEINFSHELIANTPNRICFTINENSVDEYKSSISKARTYGFMNQIHLLQKMGLCIGGGLDNAIVLDENGMMNKEPLRYENEFVAHKLLDSIGDIALLGYRIKGKYTAYMPGHSLNNALCRQLLLNPGCYKVY